jgi:cytidyltransferase-like protein
MSIIVGLTSGCWDLFHNSHLHYLRRCKDLCDKLIVGVDSDEMVRKSKGLDRPIIPEKERFDLINTLEIVDTTFILHNLVDLETISRSFRVSKIFKHQGFADIDNVIGVKNTPAELAIVPDIEGMVSTTEIIQRILDRYTR